MTESIVCLSGLAGTGILDTLLLTPLRLAIFPGCSAAMSGRWRNSSPCGEFVRFLHLALLFAAQGREGKPLGALFILPNRTKWRRTCGNWSSTPSPAIRVRIAPFTTPTSSRRYANSRPWTVPSSSTRRALSNRRARTSAPAAAFLCIRGVCARHAAAAALTDVTSALAIVVSESSGTVTVFHRGIAMLELEKPQPT